MKKIFILIITFFISLNTFSQNDSTVLTVEKFRLLEKEIPENFELKIIEKEIEAKGFLGNPGYMTEELVEKVFSEHQQKFFSTVFVAVYIHKETKEEIVLMSFKLNEKNTYFDGVLKIGKLLINDYDMLIISSFDTEKRIIENIAGMLTKRTKLRLVE